MEMISQNKDIKEDLDCDLESKLGQSIRQGKLTEDLLSEVKSMFGDKSPTQTRRAKNKSDLT